MTYATTTLRNEIHRIMISSACSTTPVVQYLLGRRIEELERAIAILEAGQRPDSSTSAASEREPTQPSTFTACGLEWIRHVPGDPMPCDGEAVVRVMLESDRRDGAWDMMHHGQAAGFHWGRCTYSETEIVGWNLHKPA